MHIYEAAWFETKHQSFADSADETFWYVSNFCCNKQDRHSFPKPRLSQVEVELLLFQLGLAAAKIVFYLVCLRFDKAMEGTGSVWIWGDVIAQAFCVFFSWVPAVSPVTGACLRLVHVRYKVQYFFSISHALIFFFWWLVYGMVPVMRSESLITNSAVSIIPSYMFSLHRHVLIVSATGNLLSA